MPIQAERRHRWDYGPGLWGCCFGGPWRRPSRREKTEVLNYVAELKKEFRDAEERGSIPASLRRSLRAASTQKLQLRREQRDAAAASDT